MRYIKHKRTELVLKGKNFPIYINSNITIYALIEINFKSTQYRWKKNSKIRLFIHLPCTEITLKKFCCSKFTTRLF